MPTYMEREGEGQREGRRAPEADGHQASGGPGRTPTHPLQAVADAGARQRLPQALRSNLEGLSGHSLADVRVHYNSSKPAQMMAHAYAQGRDIHLGPGQERHLPHEAWHVVQQAQGRVRPTAQLAGGTALNDDASLESEADRMGSMAMRASQAPVQRVAQGAETASVPAPAPAYGGNAPVQRVRFANSNSFYGPQHAVLPLPADMREALGATYRGRAERQEVMIALTHAGQQWLGQHAPIPGGIGALCWAEILDADWRQLGKGLPAIEVADTTFTFFNHQASLMQDLGNKFQHDLQASPGRPLRVASFVLQPDHNNDLAIQPTNKPIEQAVAPSITARFVVDDDALLARIRENVLSTLLSAGQLQWILANWGNVSQTHDVFIDVDFYPNRTPDRGGLLHKDSVGETLFVNLTYNNPQPGASPEYVHDNLGHAPYEQGFPQSAHTLLADVRRANLFGPGGIEGVDLPARGRVSFIDPAIWHATPLYGRRLELPSYGDGDNLTYAQVRDDIERNVPQERRAEARAVIAGLDGPVTGAQIKALYRSHESLRYGTTADGTRRDTAPLIRRRRARSVDLTHHPEHQQALQQQSQQARSFIRTWVILRRKPPQPQQPQQPPQNH
ncbi:MAG: DUF4157 domain-containing protein [Cupriavidus sp.]|nr:MAG: DUF4157 domain-containing protein [Cupriavidus sp.]